MLYIKENNVNFIPISSKITGKTVIFENQTTHSTISFNLTIKDKYYYSFYVGKFGLDEGQYTYKVLKGDKTVESGIAQFGDYKNDTTQYNNDKITYKTYDYNG